MVKPAVTRNFFAGIDSDGCVFDTMELKWKECFIPELIRCYELQGVSRYARETIEFVNLYSKDRGCNRFIGLVKSLDLLKARPEVAARGFEENCEVSPSLREWVATEPKLGEPALEHQLKKSQDAGLVQALAWSQAVNRSIAGMVRSVPPYPLVQKCLERLKEQADMIVCSGTPTAALRSEWGEHGLDRFVDDICGQEAGKKTHILSRAATYECEKRLMIGDAPGDYQAAAANDFLFYPINPGDEEESWRRFYDEGIDRFISGAFAGDYQQQIIEEFNNYLPEHPPWTAE